MELLGASELNWFWRERAARQQLLANAATKTDGQTERSIRHDIRSNKEIKAYMEQKEATSHKLAITNHSQSITNHQLRKSKHEQAATEGNICLMKNDLSQTSKDLTQAKRELAYVRYQINIDQMKPEERDEAAVNSAKKKQRIRKIH